jgi:hypothetical protein
MTPLGKSVVFYFKYQPEMLRLYWKNQKNDEISDPEILRMVEIVGDHCCQQLGEFLLECGKIIEAHFAESLNVRHQLRVTRNGTFGRAFGQGNSESP